MSESLRREAEEWASSHGAWQGAEVEVLMLLLVACGVYEGRFRGALQAVNEELLSGKGTIERYKVLKPDSADVFWALDWEQMGDSRSVAAGFKAHPGSRAFSFIAWTDFSGETAELSFRPSLVGLIEIVRRLVRDKD